MQRNHISNSRQIRGYIMTVTRPIVPVDEFFHDDPNTPWKPLPDHDLKRSPCYPIIGIRTYRNYKIPFYYCKLHPNIYRSLNGKAFVIACCIFCSSTFISKMGLLCKTVRNTIFVELIHAHVVIIDICL
jgi:hypothetical protein